MIRIWDLVVRLAHWTLVGAVSIAWLSTLHVGVPGAWHEPAGYVAATTLVTRVIWGLVAHGPARFTAFVRGPRVVLHYARQVWRHQEPRYLGHNPLGGWMVVALLTSIGAITLTGWLQTTDRYWGSETLETVHASLAWGLLGLIALHVGGVVVTSVRHRESLVRAMVTGHKRTPQAGDIL